MSEDKKKTHKRKLLIRYLILAACILVIAAVTVISVFAANDWFRGDVSIDTGLKDPDDKDPDDGKEPEEPDKPTNSDTTFASPLTDLDVINVFDFYRNESLYGTWHFHTGLDIAAKVGTAVTACLDGTIEDIAEKTQLDGTTVTIKHDNGLVTKYCFVDVKSGLKKGDSVKRGDTIGTVAEPSGSEFMQSAHLHFEVIENGEVKDPATFLEMNDK